MKAPQPYIAPRTCTEAEAGKSKAESKLSPQSLEEHADEGAYVLLAPPGSGKTSEFKRQAKLCDGQFVSARDFIAFKDKSEWHDRTLFIDGLDEVRAGSADGRTSFDGIRKKLLQLGKPKFRLSCREADWFGSNDRRHLETVAPEGKVLVLRLDPLPEEGIKAILRKNHNIKNPDAFVDKAWQRGVAALLENPLSLELLVKAVMKNEWPDSRIRTFEMACETLADETNEEHQYATIRERANMNVLLDTAGKLCAVLLLAGAPGIQLSAGNKDDNFIELNELTGIGWALQLESLKTRLFEAPNSEFAIPLHRQIAEFLGARYLTELVENGLPTSRILALMSGYDGMVVTELRGLCAWLATHSPVARDLIIDRDSLGTVLYGDVSGFPVRVKQRILSKLEKVSQKDGWSIATINFDSRLGDLVSPELTNEILTILENPARDSGKQSLMLFLVETLCHAQPLEGMAPTLMSIIRDESRWMRIRRKAINAFVQQRGNERKTLEELKSLMQEVYLGEVSDPEDDLLGRLLDETYPSVLPGAEVLDYMRVPKVNQFLSNEVFWTLKLPRKATCKQKEELLDHLASRYDVLGMNARQSKQRSKISTEIPLILLDRYLAECPGAEKVESRRLFRWLAAAGRVGDWGHDVSLSYNERGRVRSWLGQRPKLWKALLKLGLERCKDRYQETGSSDYQKLMWMEENRRLFGAKRPLDFATWCLDEALATDDKDTAKWLVHRVADEIEDERISRALVDSRLDSKELLQNALQERMSEHAERKSWQKKQEKAERIHEQEEQKEEDEECSHWQIAVRDHQTELIENRAPMPLLHNLARAYFGGYHGMSEYTPHERLNILLGDDSELVESVLAGLRAVVFRSDLPTPKEVIRQGALNQIYYSSFPFLAGFNELSLSGQNTDFFQDENRNRLALAYYYNVTFWLNPWGYGDADLEPGWLMQLLKKRSDLAAETLTGTVSLRLRRGMDVSHILFELAYSEGYEKAARRASLPILKKIPIRCKAQQLSSFRFLLIAAHRHCPKDLFVELIEGKLALASMNVAQRVYWLTAGFLAITHQFRKRLHDYVAENVKRVTYLNQFIAGRFEYSTNESEQIDSNTLFLLIKLLGTVYPPYSSESASDSDSEEGGKVTHEMDASFRINEFITQLSRDSSDDASLELMKLASDDSLKAWHTQLKYAISHQKSIRREAEFKHASLPAILDVLKNKQPANAADLAALTIDYLVEIMNNIRDGNTSDWRQYWNVDSYNRTEKPKPEDVCRDNLLSDLQQRLAPLDVDAQREGSYADDKRADIRVSFGGFNVPIEIKRSCHRDLWTAIRTQLIAKYTRDPGADGNGIYLVFWFGNHEKCRATPDASPAPKSAEELKHRLEGSLTDAERRKISVCVIDVEDRKSAGM